MNLKTKSLLAIIFIVILLGWLFTKELSSKNAKDKLVFWHYWTGAEKTPLETLVKNFNQVEDEFQVELLAVSNPRKKYLMAINSGSPPDLIHLDSDMVIDLGLRHALTTLDFKQNHFENIFLEILNINGKQLALPLLPSCQAMHINTDLVATIPNNLDDILAISKEKNTANFFVWHPKWPSWTGQFLPVVFGGTWAKKSKGKWQITANSQENIEAWSWMQKNFSRGFYENSDKIIGSMTSAYQSADNPFYAGKIGLENNGIWEKKLAKIYAPKLKIKTIAFPGPVKNATYVSSDAIAIPRGAKHKIQAEKFISWLTQEKQLEYLALKHEKFTPLKKHSPDFFSKHPNKEIEVFTKLAASPNATYFPKLAFIQKYKREIKLAYDKVFKNEMSAESALSELQQSLEFEAEKYQD